MLGSRIAAAAAQRSLVQKCCHYWLIQCQITPYCTRNLRHGPPEPGARKQNGNNETHEQEGSDRSLQDECSSIWNKPMTKGQRSHSCSLAWEVHLRGALSAHSFLKEREDSHVFWIDQLEMRLYWAHHAAWFNNMQHFTLIYSMNRFRPTSHSRGAWNERSSRAPFWHVIFQNIYSTIGQHRPLQVYELGLNRVKRQPGRWADWFQTKNKQVVAGLRQPKIAP